MQWIVRFDSEQREKIDEEIEKQLDLLETLMKDDISIDITDMTTGQLNPLEPPPKRPNRDF